MLRHLWLSVLFSVDREDGFAGCCSELQVSGVWECVGVRTCVGDQCHGLQAEEGMAVGLHSEPPTNAHNAVINANIF